MKLYEVSDVSQLFFFEDGNFGGEVLFHRLTYNTNKFVWINANDKRKVHPEVQEKLEAHYQQSLKDFDNLLEDYQNSNSIDSEKICIKIKIDNINLQREIEQYGTDLWNKEIFAQVEDGILSTEINFVPHTVTFCSTKEEHINKIKEISEKWEKK